MRKIVVFLCVLSFVGLCVGQAGQKSPAKSRPDFSGAWTLDSSRGNYKRFNAEVAKGGMTLNITQNEPEIKVTRKFILDGKEQTQELVYYTDERGEINPVMMSNVLIKSKTKWDGKKLVSKSTTETVGHGSKFWIDTTEKWELSADGETMTQTGSISQPRGNVPNAIFVPANAEDVKKVFKRVH